MNTNWIDDVLRLNARIVATRTIVSAQGDRILEMLEAREDTSLAEALFKSYGRQLAYLRMMQAELLQQPEASK
ncbi:hypothetical protein [Methylobacterium sp. V23]|uniref:hypothetical protein n=1 Tax=Methylobacterium sp. V23 TaxID=2044878 RepID=UPI000CDA1068|nr:hypothetical protein [Methylobacterium sp. V23]POR40909.1 hypothetical protein CRT23_21360 [Methylobacterium sp. V23]